MNEKLYYRVIIGLLSINLLIGCTKVSSESKMREFKSFPAKQDKSIISITSQKKYVENEPISFKINTGEVKGYLHIFYLDKDENLEVLYPKKDTKLKKKSGELLFPKDFDNIDVNAIKDCKSCEKEKTTVYVLLSDEPILEIESLDKDELLGLNLKPIKNRGFFLGNSLNSKIHIGKIEFFVE